MANASSKAQKSTEDEASTPEGTDGSEIQRDAQLANEASPATEPGGDEVATGTEGEEKPKRKRSAPKTLDERVAELREQYEERESKRKGRILKEIGTVEDKIGKAQTKLIELTKERNDLRASIGLLPEDVDLTEQGPDADEILADPEGTGDTTARQVPQS